MASNTESHDLCSSAAISRRSFLRYVGFGIGAGLIGSEPLGPLGTAIAGAARGPQPLGWVRPDGSPAWWPVAYPLPLPGDGGSASGDAARLGRFEVRDALVLPDGFRWQPIAFWGDRFGPTIDSARQVRFGYACDYTGLIPLPGTPDAFWLVVNHEYISGRPWLQGWNDVHADRFGPCPVNADGKLRGKSLLGASFDLMTPEGRNAIPDELREDIRRICSAAMSDLGVSVLRVLRHSDGTFAVDAESDDHFRISGLPEDNRALIDAGSFRFSGPAASLLGTPTGTFANCSGETTPWGTFLTCEENFQDQVAEYIAPDGSALAGDTKLFGGLGDAGTEPGRKLPFEFEGLGTGLAKPLDGRQCGWVCEIDPFRRTMVKHTALGRFRHENVSLRVERGRKLVAYLGDDRRGGHVWKFVSDDVVTDVRDPSNSRLLTKGTFYVAKLNADYTGKWIALHPETPIAKPEPETTADGIVWLPSRPAGGHLLVGTAKAVTGKKAIATVAEWQSSIEKFTGKPLAQSTLGDLVAGAEKLGVILTDAYAMANAAGGTPCARPEHIAVHPRDKSVYIAFTDSTGSGDGSPDVRIFPDSGKKNSRQYGAIYRLAETNDDATGDSFTWGKFVAAGEVAEQGAGFACADNLVFDADANLWMVCDITTPTHNFPVTRDSKDKTTPGEKNFLGVFGNNAMFMIPTSGPHAGVPFCFATGPMECELTGPTFTKDGRTLILSVQHPGELYGARADSRDRRSQEERMLKIAARDGSVFEQRRLVPLGSTFPTGRPGDVPRPAVVCVVRV